jgi:type IV pilus assembly protein PilC
MARALDTSEQKKKLIPYRYEALSSQGKLVKGNIKAANEVDAERLIIEQGHSPINVEVVPSMFSLEEAFPTLFKVKPRDVIVFSRQMATLLRSGISLLPAMEILHGQVTTSRAFKKILESIINDLRAGSSFPQAIAKHPKAFSEVYCRTIAVGEQSGNLEIILNRMADYQEKQSAVVGKIGKALTYPLMILGMGIMVIVVLMLVVMPQMMNMFEAMSVELPLPTKILIALSNFISTYPLYILIAVVLLAALIIYMIKQPTGRRVLDRIRLSAPLIGVPSLMGELARFCRTTSMLAGAGLSLQEIMEMMPQSSNNRVIREALGQVNEGLLLGEGLSGPMSRIDIFPPLLVQMVAVGEESNTLDFTLGVVADFYEVTAEEKTAAMVGMLGPMSTAGIALLVGFIAISIIMPMYTLTGSFGQ